MMFWKVFIIIIKVSFVLSISGYHFNDNKSQKRFVPEKNGNMTFRLNSWPRKLGCCFTAYIDFDRYSSISTFLDFR